ncbi:MAG: type II toxin-antitoxin system VapC family toxin [Thermoproteota archaeon]
MEPESYVDVNVFVYWLGNHPTFGKLAYDWIKKIESSQRGKYITSSLTLYQTLVILAGLTGKSMKDENLVRSVVDAIKNLPGLDIIPLSLDDLEKAVSLMKDYNLDYEDALHLAVALRRKAKEIISNDEDFNSMPLKRIF